MYKVEQIENYVFFDGKKTYQVNKSFQNDLPSDDYDIVSKSFVFFQECKLNLFTKRKDLSTFIHFTKEQLEEIKVIFDLEIVKKIDNHYLFKGSNYNSFYFVETDNLILIYSLGGMHAKEYIYLHGLWKK